MSSLAIELIRQVASPNSVLLCSNGCFKNAVVGSAHLFYATPDVPPQRREHSPPGAEIKVLTRPTASEPSILESPTSRGKRHADQIEDKSLEERLRIFYKQHQPTLIERASKIAQLYSGREEVLNTNLSSTYGADLTSLTAKDADPHARMDMRSHLAPARHEPPPPSLLKPSAAVTADPALRALAAGGRRSVDPVGPARDAPARRPPAAGPGVDTTRGGGRETRGAERAGGGGGGGVEGALPPWAKPLDLPQFLRLLRRDAFVPDILSAEQVVRECERERAGRASERERVRALHAAAPPREPDGRAACGRVRPHRKSRTDTRADGNPVFWGSPGRTASLCVGGSCPPPASLRPASHVRALLTDPLFALKGDLALIAGRGAVPGIRGGEPGAPQLHRIPRLHAVPLQRRSPQAPPAAQAGARGWRAAGRRDGGTGVAGAGAG